MQKLHKFNRKVRDESHEFSPFPMGIIPLTCRHNLPNTVMANGDFPAKHTKHTEKSLPVPLRSVQKAARAAILEVTAWKVRFLSPPSRMAAHVTSCRAGDMHPQKSTIRRRELRPGQAKPAAAKRTARRGRGRRAKGLPFGPAASSVSPPGTLPERLRLPGRVPFRVFRVFRGKKVSRQVNDITPQCFCGR